MYLDIPVCIVVPSLVVFRDQDRTELRKMILSDLPIGLGILPFAGFSYEFEPLVCSRSSMSAFNLA